MTIQHGSIDVAARPTLRVLLDIPEATRAALAEAQVEAPDRVALLLIEGTRREEIWFTGEMEKLNAEVDRAAFLQREANLVAELMHRRSEIDYPRDVLVELARDMSETAIAQVTAAFLSGRLEDPKALAGAIASTKANATRLILSAMNTGETSLTS